MGKCAGCRGKVREREAIHMSVSGIDRAFCCRGCVRVYEYEHGFPEGDEDGR